MDIEEYYVLFSGLLTRDELDEEQQQVYSHCMDILSYLVLPICNRNINKINDLEVGWYIKQTSEENDYIAENHYYVCKDNKVVFHAIQNGIDGYEIYNYVPGSWEDELDSFLKEKRIR